MNAEFKNRIPELDIARGIAVFLMIIDHFFYDLWGLMPDIFPLFASTATFEIAHRYWVWDVRIYIRYAVLAVFMLLTGVCCTLSRSNLKRGLKLMGVALLLTLATYLIGVITDNPDFTITFGVLHCISLALILTGLLEKFIKSRWFFLILGSVLLVVGIICNRNTHFMSYGSNNIIVLLLSQIVGICECGSDSFSFLLYGAQIFIGVFLGKQFYSDKKSIFKNPKYPSSVLGRVVCFVGRSSLLVYFAHQIIIPIFVSAILLICGYKMQI